ncbi:MAG: metal-responsive CopG/Arc/MetJ family transcriptional regulator [Acidimicrobiales bacterium]|jgi:metal-responsive CopG/Arc/MetJ family transcriptional regulator
MKTISITLPEALYKKVETVRKKGHYTRSEFIREVLRSKIGVPTVQATTEEIKSAELGKKEIEAGEFLTLDELKTAVL